MSSLLSDTSIAQPAFEIQTKKHRHDKREPSGRKAVFIPSPEFLAIFLDWRKSRLKLLPLKCLFDRWYEALSKEHIWYQWMLRGLVKDMDIPSRNTLAHLYVNASTPETEKRIGSAKRGLLPINLDIVSFLVG